MSFYATARSDADYQHLWRRIAEGKDILAVGARLEGQPIGFFRYLFNPSAWSTDVCCLQDWFVDESSRGQGVARALVGYIARHAKERRSPRLYWLTHESNATARNLYDKVAAHNGFIRYEMALP